MRIVFLLLGIFGFIVNSNAATTTITAADGVRYILDLENHTAEVTFKNGFSRSYSTSNYTLTDIVIPEKIIYQDEEYLVTSIGKDAFYNCLKLEHIQVPDNIVSIGEYAFYKCSNLLAFDFPEELTSIGTAAFLWCSNIERLVFPLKLTELPEIGFEYFYALNYLVIPPGISYIGNNCFYTPASINDKVICLNPTPVELDGYNVFSPNVWNGSKIYVPAGSVDAYKKLNGWNKARNLLPLTEASAIFINGEENTVKVGQQIQLSVSLLPEDVTCDLVEWKVENPEIAKISQKGIVTGTAPGQTNIIAVTLDGSNLTAEYPVTVLADKKILLGDSNDNEIVTVADVITTAYYIAGLPTTGWNFENADVNGDKTISIADVTATTEIILNEEAVFNQKRKLFTNLMEDGESMSIDAKLSVSDQSVDSGQSFEASVDLDFGNSGSPAYSGFQFDVVLPQGITFEDYTISPQLSNDFIVSSKTSEKGIVRIIGFAYDASTTLDKGFITLTFKVDKAPAVTSCAIKLNQAYLSAPDGSDIPLLDSEFIVNIRIVAYAVELNPSELTLLVGDTSPITATVEPANVADKTIAWKSENESVATVGTDGTVTAVSIGTAIITAKCGTVSSTCTVTVIPVPSEGIVISPSSVSMLLGDNVTLTATVFPENTTDKSVTWSSDNPGVASVSSNGVVTALSLGTATITARNGNATASCRVTVNPVVATGISLNVKDETIFVASSTQLVASISPSNVTDKTITWTSSKPEIATVTDQGEVLGVAVGTTTVTATCGSVSASCQINVVHRIPDMDPFVTTSERDIQTLSGRQVNMAVYAEGGEPTGWSFQWTKDGKTVSETSELNITAINDTETVKAETYRVKVENEIDKVVILSQIFDFVVQIYPAVEGVSEEDGISISTGTGNSGKTREGNEVTLSINTPAGGNPRGWEYVWSSRGEAVGEGNPVETVATMSSGNSMAIELTTYELEMTNYGPEGDVWARFNLEAGLEVYRRPLTPSQMLRKGDGTSHTFVVMMPLSDTELEKLGYRFVYGWTDSDGNEHVMDRTELRYCYTDAEIYNNPANKFWVYSIWNYSDGSVISSGLRYLDGRVDESFDASVFDGSGDNYGVDKKTRTAIYTLDGHYMGTDRSRLVPGIYIHTTETHGMVKTQKIIIR